ncbi:endonuclease/exonuclease/phosphatase family protein [Altibacter sp.]|uniref:endonuclease/exonuclease/phosphatase family protein n=1 Tax=Altibacter sp. TaxID=2024823 RepID=UPI00258BACCA|nr:endonuclease/exonuclease/phosphatase family protein [Altibacter sp.]MCW8980801.1 endonuclease/exonuclease/phosphatase family protein [Altibacter sp.]MCW9037599.1 endonuclease/exonuclease/phosphatase family protein [Altibacter sp.]
MRSKKGLLHSVIYWSNIIAVILLLVSFVLPYLRPSAFPTLALLSLAVSPLLLLNVLFMIYWMFRGKRTFLISMVVLIIAYLHFNPFFEFSSEGDASEYTQSLSLLSYNVRLFNAYEEDPSEGVSETINAIIQNDTPDILCIQEYYRESTFDFSEYPYQFIHFKDGNNKLGHAIFSKFPFAKTGAFDFEDSHNNTLFADIVKGPDTLRVYNLHLQSLGILPRVEYLQEGNKERLRKRMSRAFVMQEEQAAAILAHKAMSPYPVIISGDFNNTPFSYVYRTLQEGMTDAFVERGSGIGTTFKFDGYPMRIDYILPEASFDVLRFETIRDSFSDHYPVKATVGWGTKKMEEDD